MQFKFIEMVNELHEIFTQYVYREENMNSLTLVTCESCDGSFIILINVHYIIIVKNRYKFKLYISQKTRKLSNLFFLYFFLVGLRNQTQIKPYNNHF